MARIAHPVDRLAVCSWSLQPKTSQELVDYLKQIGIMRVQLALDPLRTDPGNWDKTKEIFAANKIQIVSGMMTTVGEDYSTMESIRRTGGVLPDSTWEENWKNAQEITVIAKKLGVKLVTFHAGFLPHDERDPSFSRLFERIGLLADLFAAKDMELGFETGQETAETLKIFLEKLQRPSVGVNFDPANMILYDKGNPIQALRTLGPFLKQCHIKDANRTKQPGTWGDEVVVGTGQVNWPQFFEALREMKYPGCLCIEREAGNQRVADIRAARDFLQTILK